jgi:hypothetical protein
MSWNVKGALLAGLGVAALTALAPSASAQQVGRPDTGVPTETQERLSEGQDDSFDWNWLGLIGLFGLAGLHHKPDYAHPI